MVSLNLAHPVWHLRKQISEKAKWCWCGWWQVNVNRQLTGRYTSEETDVHFNSLFMLGLHKKTHHRNGTELTQCASGIITSCHYGAYVVWTCPAVCANSARKNKQFKEDIIRNYHTPRQSVFGLQWARDATISVTSTWRKKTAKHTSQ